jgi:hypothetical protein
MNKKNTMPEKPQNMCESLRDDWLKCKYIYKGSAAFSHGDNACDGKFEKYIYNCGKMEEEKKRFRCSIYATH